MCGMSDFDRQNKIDSGKNFGYVCCGRCILSAYKNISAVVDFAGAGATVPLTGFGYNLCKGVEKAVSEKGFLGIFTGGLTAASGGIAAALVFGFLVSIILGLNRKNSLFKFI